MFIMGDMADYYLEQMCDHEEFWDNQMYEETTDSHLPPRPRKIPSCRCCGKTPLVWKNIDGTKWRLFETDDSIHNCPKNPLKTMNDPMISKIQKLTHKPLEQLLPIPEWDETFMHDVYWWARRSKDPSTKIGAVLVHWNSKDPISHAYNGFARSVDDNVENRWERPEKYFWISHAESNSILNCSRTGRSTIGTVMFTQAIPCADCANDIIQAGVAEVVVHQQWQEFERIYNWSKWTDSSKRSIEKFGEAGVKIRVMSRVLGVQGLLDGKIISV